MTQISTLNLITKSLYENLTREEESLLQDLGITDYQDRFEQLKMKRVLGSIVKSPSKTSVDIVLKYSRQHSKLDPIF